MNYLNDLEFNFSNITHWHKLGYTGKGVKIANLEGCNINAWNLKNKVKDPFNINRKDTNNHGDKTTDILLQVAPDAIIYSLPNGGYYINGSCEGDLIDNSFPYIEQENIHLVNASIYGVDVDCINKKVKELKNKGVIFVSGSGNRGSKGTWGFNSSNGWITVGAVHLSKNGDINIAEYSSIGEEVDFVQFSGIYVNNQKDKDYSIPVIGTSFSSPLFTAMLALVQQFFMEKTGQILNQELMYKFILDNSIDLGTSGKDIEYGHGLFVLPNPDDIDINRYVKGDNMDKFKDVEKTDWFYEAVKYATENGIMKGYKDGTFRPDQPLTRAEIAQIEYNRHLRGK